MSQENIIDLINKIEPQELREALFHILVYKQSLAKNSRGARDNPKLKRLSELDSVFINLIRMRSGVLPGIVKYGSSEHEELKIKIRKNVQGLSKDELIEKLVDASCAAKQLGIHAERYREDAKTLFNLSINSLIRELASFTARERGLKSNRTQDEEWKSECLKSTLANLGRNPVPEDYPTFVKNLKTKFPKPSFVPKPRLTAEEKSLPKEERDKIIEIKTDLNWKESTLRKFWEDKTKLKARTKKLSSAK